MKKDFEIDINPQDILKNKEKMNRGAPKKEESKKLTINKRIGFTASEYEKLQKSYNDSEFSSFSSFLRHRLLKD